VPETAGMILPEREEMEILPREISPFKAVGPATVSEARVDKPATSRVDDKVVAPATFKAPCRVATPVTPSVDCRVVAPVEVKPPTVMALVVIAPMLVDC